jgi:hypothetical protein
MKLAIWIKDKDGRYKVNPHLEIADKLHLLRELEDGSLGCTMNEKIDSPELTRLIEEHRKHFIWEHPEQKVFPWGGSIYRLREPT